MEVGTFEELSKLSAAADAEAAAAEATAMEGITGTPRFDYASRSCILILLSL